MNLAKVPITNNHTHTIINSMEAWQTNRHKVNIIIALKKLVSHKMNIYSRKYHVTFFRP